MRTAVLTGQESTGAGAVPYGLSLTWACQLIWGGGRQDPHRDCSILDGYEAGMGIEELAARFGLSQVAITRIVSRSLGRAA